MVSAHKVIPSNGCRDSFDCIGDDPNRLTERDRENNLEVASGEREREELVGEGVSFCICWAGGCFESVN